MSTWTRRWISCDADLCEDVFWGRPGRASSELAEELRSRARAEGWKHRQGGIDLCPAHREVET